MLKRLIIKNYAIISELDLAIQPGLSIITGETGAGKSILLGALGLALGKRADAKVMTDENQKCIVEAHFLLSDHALEELFEKEGLDFDNILICRREISSGGRSRSFINDTPVQLRLLQEITSHLIELHHQHDNLALQSKDYQVSALDILSRSGNLFKEYKLIYLELSQLRSELSRLKELEISSIRRKDFLTFQIDELDNAQIKSGEIARLEESQNLLQHGEAIAQSLEHLQNSLMDGQHAINQQLTALIKQLDGVRLASPAIESIADRLMNVRLEIQDIALEASRLEGLGQKDPVQLTKIQSRLNQLYTLIKKYQSSNEENLHNKHQQLRAELNELTSVGEQILELEKNITSRSISLFEKGKSLSDKRKTGAPDVIQKMNFLLNELGMPNGKFSIEIQPAEPGPDGIDEIEFLFSANKGMPIQPLAAVASGGELSRLSLALKSLYAAQAKLPTIIFDEIDTGISGEVAWRMGQLIRELAKGHQILMITHSPQIAAHAGTQYHVSKVLTNGKDTSSVQLLNKDTRLVELAKMLSGDPPSKEALANAKSLVKATSQK